MNALLVIITSLLLDTTSTQAYVQGQFGQSAMPLTGVQDGGFSVQAQSVFDINDVSRVFGEAGYTWGQSEGNRWVENADYELLYPYLTCDTIGGGMRSEQYSFRGGYRMAKHHIIWHLALQYRALQSYRSIDPRPKNKVADLRIDGSVGYIDDRYAYSLVGQVGRYKQNNAISFYSEAGNSTIYHLVQTNEDYARFAGDFTSSYYHGFTAGAQAMLQPRLRGWLAGVDYHCLSVTKELNNSTFTPIALLRTHDIGAQLGYAAPLWRVSLQAAYVLRTGTQYYYGDVAGNYYHLLYKAANYREQQCRISLNGTYRLNLPVGYLCFAADADYLHKIPSSLSATPAHPYFQDLSAYLTASQLHTLLSVRYTFPIASRYAWFISPSAAYTHYFSSSSSFITCVPVLQSPLSPATFDWQVSLKTGISF